jgi:hypothetical protein
MIAATEKSVHFFCVDFPVGNDDIDVSRSLSRERKRDRLAIRKALFVTIVSSVADIVGMLSNSLSAKQRRLRNRSLRIGAVEKRFIPLFSFL